MSDIQRVIKYVAIAFAIFLAVNIISVIVLGIGNLFMVFSNDEIIKMHNLNIDHDYAINNLEIDVAGTSLVIEEGETFKIETNNKYIDIKQNKDNLIIKEKNHNWFRNNGKSKLVIYMPNNFELNKLDIDAGAGKVEISSLITNEIDFDLGAGQVIIDNLIARRKASIEGGAGEVIIKKGIINNLEFDMGVGHADITADLTGNSDIEAGVGELDIKLLGNKKDYRIRVEKGLGNINIDGENLKNNQTYGEGARNVLIEGGVGSISVKFEKDTLSSGVHDSEDNEKKEFTRTYKLLNKTPCEEENSYYLTLQIFQGEVDTVIVRNFKDELVAGKTYEFTFLKDESINLKEESLKEIFKSYKVTAVLETNKIGLEQRQDTID